MVICQRGAPDLRSLSPVVLVMAERCTKIDEPCAFRAATAPWFRQARFPQIAEAVWSGTGRTADLPRAALQPGSQHVELAAWRGRVESVLDQPAGRLQASQ